MNNDLDKIKVLGFEQDGLSDRMFILSLNSLNEFNRINSELNKEFKLFFVEGDTYANTCVNKTYVLMINGSPYIYSWNVYMDKKVVEVYLNIEKADIISAEFRNLFLNSILTRLDFILINCYDTEDENNIFISKWEDAIYISINKEDDKLYKFNV